MDFTLKVYRKLLATLKEGGFDFQTFESFLIEPRNRVVILRHDVDLKPKNSLVTSEIECELGISGSYYFRNIPQSFDCNVIRQIHELGHEIGYHYECMNTVGYWLNSNRDKNNNHDSLIDLAYEDFRMNLQRLRMLVPVSTVVMHGSPRSKYNNLDLWEKYDYRDLGIIGEPYLDVDFSDVFYLTDTGRRWDGASVNVRDKVNSGFSGSQYVFRSTYDIISAVENSSLPSRIMITVHPQRWTDSGWPWLRELVWQNIKNQVKRFIVKA